MLIYEAYAGFGDFAFEYAFVACVSEKAYVHCLRTVEEVLEGDVVDEVLGEVFVGVRIGGIVAAYHYLEPVVEQ